MFSAGGVSLVDSHQSRSATLDGLTLVSFCSRLPVLGADDWQADLTLLVDVGMVDFRFEGDPGRLEGVFSREDELHSKGSLVVRRAILPWEESRLHIEVAPRGSRTFFNGLPESTRVHLAQTAEYLPEQCSLAR